MAFLADLDIEKHGLGHLAEKRPVDFTPDEIEQALDAFDKEDMAPPVFDATVNPSRTDELLSRSHCRNCGKCCLPNPRNPSCHAITSADNTIIDGFAIINGYAIIEGGFEFRLAGGSRLSHGFGGASRDGSSGGDASGTVQGHGPPQGPPSSGPTGNMQGRGGPSQGGQGGVPVTF